MKKDIHPQYQKVLFLDTATGVKFLIGTTLQPEGARESFEGKEYPVYKVAISSASHPLYTGTTGMVDTEGRVDKFRKRYAEAKRAVVTAEKSQEPAQKSSGKKAKQKVSKK